MMEDVEGTVSVFCKVPPCSEGVASNLAISERTKQAVRSDHVQDVGWARAIMASQSVPNRLYGLTTSSRAVAPRHFTQ